MAKKKGVVPSMSKEDLIAEINRADGLLEGLSDLQIQLTDKITSLRLRLQLLNKRLR